jgi:hypothetical protein
MKLAPIPKHNQVNSKINEVLARVVYADPLSFEMRLLRRECEDVLSVEPFMGWALLGSFFSALGDSHEADRCFSASLRLRNDSVTHVNYYTNLGNLGLFSKAHQYFVEHGRPEQGRFLMMRNFAQTMGSFQTAVAYTREAEAMGIELMEPLAENCRDAAEILASAGISDEDVVLHMDVVGEVLRRRKMFYHDIAKVRVSNVQGVFVGVTCVLAVAASSLEAFEMNMELAQLEREMNVSKHSAFDVIFKPNVTEKLTFNTDLHDLQSSELPSRSSERSSARF